MNIRQLIRMIRLTHPEYALQTIGNMVGRSRERVRQILAEEGLPTKHTSPKLQKQCKRCKNLHYNKIYCSQECFFSDHNLLITCAYCKREFSKSIGKFNHTLKKNPNRINYNFYCSRICFSFHHSGRSFQIPLL